MIVLTLFVVISCEFGAQKVNVSTEGVMKSYLCYENSLSP